TMFAIAVLLCSLVFFPDNGGARLSVITETESQIIFKNELNKIAHDFQAKLRGEITRLQSDMYSEFLRFVEEVDVLHDTLSEALRVKLSDQVSDVLEKFTKVMTYSTLRVQDLSDQLQSVMVSLGSWTDDFESAVLFNHDDYVRATMHHREPSSNQRRRRHALDWLPEDSQQKHFKTTNKTELFTQLQQDELEAFFEYSDDLESNVEYEKSPFVLREYSPVLGSQVAQHLPHHTSNEASRILPMDCLDLLTAGYQHDGVYKIYPAGMSVGVDVWCDQGSVGGGWTVVVGRRAGHHPLINFTRPHLHYTHGFGDPTSHHWIGLEALHALTRDSHTTLRLHLLDHHLHHANATYTMFRVGGPGDLYRLQVGGFDPTSTAGDALTPHSGAIFSSPEPFSGGGCSRELSVGWWFLEYPECYVSLPTGQYHPPGEYLGEGGGVEWRTWAGTSYSLHTLLLMI
ncbi:hypothetical protein OTU49_016563, partial [Cherax quadricarinatus]